MSTFSSVAALEKQPVQHGTTFEGHPCPWLVQATATSLPSSTIRPQALIECPPFIGWCRPTSAQCLKNKPLFNLRGTGPKPFCCQTCTVRRVKRCNGKVSPYNDNDPHIQSASGRIPKMDPRQTAGTASASQGTPVEQPPLCLRHAGTNTLKECGLCGAYQETRLKEWFVLFCSSPNQFFYYCCKSHGTCGMGPFIGNQDEELARPHKLHFPLLLSSSSPKDDYSCNHVGLHAGHNPTAPCATPKPQQQHHLGTVIVPDEILLSDGGASVFGSHGHQKLHQLNHALHLQARASTAENEIEGRGCQGGGLEVMPAPFMRPIRVAGDAVPPGPSWPRPNLLHHCPAWRAPLPP